MGSQALDLVVVIVAVVVVVDFVAALQCLLISAVIWGVMKCSQIFQVTSTDLSVVAAAGSAEFELDQSASFAAAIAVAGPARSESAPHSNAVSPLPPPFLIKYS
jgi:hypothetical protein